MFWDVTRHQTFYDPHKIVVKRWKKNHRDMFDYREINQNSVYIQEKLGLA
jgi:hypothetical protein